jgi:hypothetical protein
MPHGDDSQVDRHRVDAFASEDELTIQEFLQAAPTAPARPTGPRRSESSLYQRIGCAGGLLWLVNTLYLRVLPGFKGSSQHRLVESTVAARSGPRLGSSNRESCEVGC